MWIFSFLGSLWGSSSVKVTAGVIATAVLLSSTVYQFNLAGQGIRWEAPPLLGALEKLDTNPQNISKVMAPSVPGVSGGVDSGVLYPLGGLDRLIFMPQFDIKLPTIPFIGTDNAVDENEQCSGLYYFRPNCLAITGLPFIPMPKWPLSLWSDPSDCQLVGRWMWHFENIVDDITCMKHKFNYYMHNFVKPASDYTYQWLREKFQYARKLAEAAFRPLIEDYKTRFTHEKVEHTKMAVIEYSMEKLNTTYTYLSQTNQHVSNFMQDQWKTVKHAYNGCMCYFNKFDLTWSLEDPRELAMSFVNSLDLSWFRQEPEVIAMDILLYCANAVYNAAWLVFVFPFVTISEGLKMCAFTLFEVCQFPFRVDSYVHWQLTPECLTPADILPIVEGVLPETPCQFYEFECVRAALILYQRLFVPFLMYLGHIIVFAYRYTMIYHLICMAFGNHICYSPLCIFHRYEFTIPDLEEGLFEDDE